MKGQRAWECAVWWRGLHYPLFVPSQLEKPASLLALGDFSQALREIHRLAALGSVQATALLAYLEFTGSVSGAPRIVEAEQLCNSIAQHGDGFARYVLGWVRFEQGREAEALASMDEAGKGLFLPALIEVGRFVSSGIGVKRADPSAAARVYVHAHRLGHRVALLYLSQLYRTGQLGWRRKLVGTVLLPFAYLRAIGFALLFPFSDKVFVHVRRAKRPLFALAPAPQHPDD